MRILLAAQRADPVVLGLARMAQRAGHRVQIAALAASPDDPTVRARQGTPVSLWPEAWSDDVGREFTRWLQAERFDVAHVFDGPLLAEMHSSLHETGLPVVATLLDLAWADAAPGAAVNAASQRLSRAAERTVPSGHAARCMAAALPELGFRVLPHGIDLLAVAAASTVRRGDEPLTLGFCGPLGARSGADLLLHAFTRVKRADLRMIVRAVGPTDNGWRQRCESMAAADSRIRFEDADAEGPSLIPMLGCIDLYCAPSLEAEAFARPVHEAACAGLHCLVSDIGAAAEAVHRYGCGQTVRTGDIAAWIDAIEQCQRGLPSTDRPVPVRIEEEAFWYEGLYRQAIFVKATT